MLFAGLPELEWEQYVYNDLSEISDPKKALIRWLQS